MSRVATEPVPEGAPTLAGGRYAIVSRIDAGGMSAVYRVWDRKLKVARALKVLLPEYARNERIHQRFESEARTMARLEHPNLVRIYDVGSEKELPYLVMELVTGGSLQRWIDTRGAMAPRLALEATLQLTAGLVAVHAAGVVHRDIKPHNVLVADPGVCKLTDFGIAHLGDNGSTKTGSTLGTQGYMAPEQRADAKSVDARADVYGVGATLWALLTGRPAHDVFLLVERSGLDQVPPYLRDLLKKTVAYARDERFPDASTLYEALRAALEQAPEDPGPAELPLDDTTDDVPIDPIEDEIAAILTGDALVSYAAEPGVSPPPSSSTPNPLPYYMPQVGRAKRSFSEAASDDEPDWIARDPAPSAGGSEEVIGAGVPVRSEEEASASAEPEAASDPQDHASPEPAEKEPPKPREAPRPKEPPKPPEPAATTSDASSTAAEESEGSSLWVFLLAPIAGLLLGALVLVLGSGALVAGSASGIRAAETAAAEQRELVYRILAEEDGAVQRFKQAGIDTTELESRYLTFQDTKGEPARQQAAREYLSALDAEAERWLGPDAASPGQVEAAHAVRRIHARVVAWDDADRAWIDAGSGLGGRVAIGLGLVRPPPDGR
jgi:serine/threonine protein kinase